MNTRIKTVFLLLLSLASCAPFPQERSVLEGGFIELSLGEKTEFLNHMSPLVWLKLSQAHPTEESCVVEVVGRPSMPSSVVKLKIGEQLPRVALLTKVREVTLVRVDKDKAKFWVRYQ